MSITIAITSITCITASILYQCPQPPSPSPSPLSHVLQLRSFNNVRHLHHHRLHVYHMHYSFNPITMSITSITIAITSITCITASILYQCPSPSPSQISHAVELQSYNNVNQLHQNRPHVYHMHYSLNLRTLSITTPSRLSHVLQLQFYINVHHHRHHIQHMH